jgi:hypothetical protein
MIKSSKINQGFAFKKIKIDLLRLLLKDVNKSFFWKGLFDSHRFHET